MKKNDIFKTFCIAATLLVAFLALSSSKTWADSSSGSTEEKTSSHKPEAGPQKGLQGLDEKGNMRISDGDRCPLCAMKVARYPKSSCAIQLTDDTTYYFCGAGCMIRSWLHPEVFLGAQAEDIKTAVVRDYFTGDTIDAKTAIWIAGSDVLGPMGPTPVALKDEKDMEVFKRRHGGKTVFRLPELDDDKWLEITGKKAAP